MASRFGSSSALPLAVSDCNEIHMNQPHLFPQAFPQSGLEAAGEDGNYGGHQRLVESALNSPASDPARGRSRNRSNDRVSRRPSGREQLAQDTAVGTAADDTLSPQVTWHTNDGIEVTLPQWLANLTSGRCNARTMGSLFYVWSGWRTVGAQITITHRRTGMVMNGSAKLCGWCRRQARRSVVANYPKTGSHAGLGPQGVRSPCPL